MMIGRKLIILQNGQILNREKFFLKTQYMEELKHLTVKNVKKHGYNGLVTIIRFYIRSTNLLLNKYQKIRIKIKNIRDKRRSDNPNQQKDVNKFLKIVSEYKHKIREIKHKIKEEEENL